MRRLHGGRDDGPCRDGSLVVVRRRGSRRASAVLRSRCFCDPLSRACPPSVSVVHGPVGCAKGPDVLLEAFALCAHELGGHCLVPAGPDYGMEASAPTRPWTRLWSPIMGWKCMYWIQPQGLLNMLPPYAPGRPGCASPWWDFGKKTPCGCSSCPRIRRMSRIRSQASRAPRLAFPPPANG